VAGTPAPKKKALGADGADLGPVQEATFTDVDAVAALLVDAKRVVVVPGYGLAVANGQGAPPGYIRIGPGYKRTGPGYTRCVTWIYKAGIAFRLVANEKCE
jgi:hypothetical protein